MLFFFGCEPLYWRHYPKQSVPGSAPMNMPLAKSLLFPKGKEKDGEGYAKRAFASRNAVLREKAALQRAVSWGRNLAKGGDHDQAVHVSQSVSGRKRR